ncbi:hypothetical protein SAMN05880501_105124 [Ureibacillus xyleni]|uniref:Uncharacterized protein n=1 Tax=Ureibacillus xyleni TaxID=614648 RepID=A0A285SKZ1_9BACL|nr:hypothetical protein [Ureibacillus xyleni]SOC08693.1 hypothetical protein SAMN05880501_105124 [Ureibacillus xyleni]
MGIGFIAAVGAGFIVGVLLRLIMKIVAIIYPNLSTGFTFKGTFLLVLMGTGFTLAVSMLYMYCRMYLARNWILSGMLYGFIVLCIFSYPFFFSDEPNSELNGPQKPLGIILFSLLFIIGGLLLAKFVNIIENWVEKSTSRIKYCYIAFCILIIPTLFITYGIVKDLIEEFLRY